ncbi:MAG TPA: biosynthetic peptidoglycan transglycosylase [Longimicrobiales bacterium]|nr:biosynthetic peptidoglycan transglycosylase [Longimicrobiales bacterium]
MMRFLRRWVLAPVLFLVSLPVVALAGLPWPWLLRWVDPPATAFMLHREREAARAGEEFTLVQDWVPLEELPDDLVRAVLVSEDDRFREHRGVDWKALAEEVEWSGGEGFSWRSSEDRAALRGAARYYWAHRSEIKGRSTLTQQLAKNLYFTPDRSLVRKAGEVVVSVRLERLVGKDRILEIYLNTAELGPGIFGVGAAARAYFDVPAQRLTRFQAASLAATLPHPLTSNPRTRPGRMAWRRDLILGRLAGRSVEIPAEPDEVPVPTIDAPPPGELAPTEGVEPDPVVVPDTVSADTVPADTVPGAPGPLR